MRYKSAYLLFAWQLVVAVVAGAQSEARLMRYPDISATQVVFAYGGDLWITPREGGAASRLTAHSGDEMCPKFSPDGRDIAFTAEYDGNADVYVMSAAGGEPRRLTYHPANDTVLGWTPDGKKVLFQSNRTNPYGSMVTQLFLVSVEGGQAEPLPLARGSQASFSEDGRNLAFTATPQTRTWKRYRGGATTYIQLLDLVTRTYRGMPRANANDSAPMWYKNSIYFASDRDGVMNLYRWNEGSRDIYQLTHYSEFDVKWPSLGRDAIIFENGGKLFYYSLKEGQTRPIPISLATENIYSRVHIKSVADQIRGATLSPSGARALISARGSIFTAAIEQGPVRKLTRSPGVHELSPAWSPNGRWVAYLSDRSGEYEVYIRPQKGGEEIRITSDGDCYRFGLVWSPDSKALLYSDKKLRLWYVGLEEKKPVLVDTAEYSPGIVGRGAWSPDSLWIAYCKLYRDGKEAVFLYSIEGRRSTPVSNPAFDDFDPQFDLTGKYLYFLSRRSFQPTIGSYDQRFSYYNAVGIFAVALTAGELPLFTQRSDEEAAQEDKKADDGKLEPPRMQIDIEGIRDRVVQVPVAAGNYGSLTVRRAKMFYISTPMQALELMRSGPRNPLNVLYSYDVKKRETKALLEGIDSYALDLQGSKVLYRAGEVIGVVDTVPGKKVGEGRLNTSGLEILADPRSEWRQMLREAWRIERDFFWDPAMGGLDWRKMWDRYEALLPWVSHRADLNYLIGEMISELGTSHTYVSGGEMPQRRQVSVGLLGVDFVADGPYYKFAKIYVGECWNENARSPLAEPGLKVAVGNHLIAVDGVEARTPADPYSYFQNLAGRPVTLKINDKPSPEGAWEITVKPVASEANLRYLDWVEHNRRRVDEASAGRVAYIHVPNTGADGIATFDKQFNAQLGKEALILDERYNAGGMIPDSLIEKLQRGVLNVLSTREGKDLPWPHVAIPGPKVLLVNELAASGGDALAWYFKRVKLGPVVGTRTWGGLVGTSRVIPMLDGGMVSAPELAFWSTEDGGRWIVENHGVDPDYVVEQRVDLEIKGQDPQLEKAIELVNQTLSGQPTVPTRPSYPMKAMAPNEH